MATIVTLNGVKAALSTDGSGWRSENPEVQKALNEILEMVRDDISGADPDPELTIAQAAVDQLGAVIVVHDEPEFDPKAIY